MLQVLVLQKQGRRQGGASRDQTPPKASFGSSGTYPQVEQTTRVFRWSRHVTPNPHKPLSHPLCMFGYPPHMQQPQHMQQRQAASAHAAAASSSNYWTQRQAASASAHIRQYKVKTCIHFQRQSILRFSKTHISNTRSIKCLKKVKHHHITVPQVEISIYSV
jgi:hypothetical protein